MNEILITILLLIPPPDKNISWKVEGIPNQLQVLHKQHNLEVSYPYKVNDCRTVHPLKHEFVFEFLGENVCYLIDTRSPSFIRTHGKWLATSGKTFNPKENTDGN